MGNIYSPIISQLYIMEKAEVCPDEPFGLYVDDSRTSIEMYTKLKIELEKDGLNLTKEDNSIHLGLKLSYNDTWRYEVRNTTLKWKHEDIWNENIGTTIGQIKNMGFFNKDDMFLRSKIWTIVLTMTIDVKLYFKTLSKIVHPRSNLNLAKYIKLLRKVNLIDEDLKEKGHQDLLFGKQYVKNSLSENLCSSLGW